MIDTARLRGIIAERGLSQQKVARAIGISSRTFYSKMNKGVFDSMEIEAMITLLRISDPAAVFFAPNVAQQATNGQSPSSQPYI